MARYDEGWRGPRRGGPMPGGANYDRADAAREAYTPGGFGPDWQRRARVADDADFRPPHGLGGGRRDADPGVGAPWGEGDEETLNGPARYGLGPYYRRLEQRRRPDDELRHEVEEALFYDTWVDAEAISVGVRDGVVTLRGELPDHDEVRYATDDAWDVDGVRGVRSELRVNPGRRKPVDGVRRPSQSRGGDQGVGNG
jgi:BON domain-containing protein